MTIYFFVRRIKDSKIELSLTIKKDTFYRILDEINRPEFRNKLYPV